MKRPFIFVLLLSFLIVIISVFNSFIFYDDDEGAISRAKNEQKYKNYESVDEKSPKINVYNADEDKTEEMDMEEYLYGVLSSEMPSTFDEEALKAQAISARTYVVYKIENNINSGHKNAAVCTNSAHCQAYTSYDDLLKKKGKEWIKSDYQKVKKAVDETKGQILTYNDKAILPLYFSTSSGKTENSKDVFSTQYPYLVSVDSPYEENSPKYITTYSIDKNKFIKSLKNIYPSIKLSIDQLENQVKILNRTEGGCVKTIQLGDVKLSGIDIRKILNLNSANFTIEYNNNNMEFIVKGYGHGVGMSQWGAQGMAKEGYKYYDILFHYFKGTDIKDTY